MSGERVQNVHREGHPKGPAGSVEVKNSRCVLKLTVEYGEREIVGGSFQMMSLGEELRWCQILKAFDGEEGLSRAIMM